MSALGFAALGDKLSPNVINSLPDGDFRKVSQLAFTISLITATYTLINPVFRQVEGPLKIEGPGERAPRHWEVTKLAGPQVSPIARPRT